MKKILILAASLLCLGVNEGSLAESGGTNLAEQFKSSSPDALIEPLSDDSEPIPLTQITVLDPGAEPRQPLRLKATVGDKQRSRMRITANPKMTVDGQSFSGLTIPPIEMTTETEIVNVESNGLIHAKFSFLEPKVEASEDTPPRFTAMLQQQFASLSQASIYYIYDSQGRLKETDIQFEGDEADALGQLLKQLSASAQQLSGMFPEEAVGIGAEWSVPYSASVSGISINQTTVYKLLAVDGDRVTLSMSLELDGKDTAIDMSQGFLSLPPDVTAEVQSVEMAGSGTVTFNLAQLIATAMNLESQLNMEMTFTDPSKATTITMDMTSNMQILDE